MAQTDTETDPHTIDGYRNLETESAHRANSVKMRGKVPTLLHYALSTSSVFRNVVKCTALTDKK